MRTNTEYADHPRTIPWRLGQGDTQRLMDYANRENLTFRIELDKRPYRAFVGTKPVGLLQPDTLDVIAWPYVRDGRSYAEIMHDGADKRPTPGLCYFIGGDDGPIKIGFSVDVPGRFKAIQACSPVALRVLATRVGGEARESAYHQQFADSRLHFEWFERTPELLAEIERLSS